MGDAMHLSNIERQSWLHTAQTTVPIDPAYFWSQVYALASRKAGESAYNGPLRESRVNQIGREILSELSVSWEDYADKLYIGGKRIFCNSRGQWKFDDFR